METDIRLLIAKWGQPRFPFLLFIWAFVVWLFSMTKIDNKGYPDFRSSDCKKRDIRPCGLVIARRNPAKLLHFVEHSLDAVAILVCLEVAGRRVFAVRFWRDDWQNAMDQQLLADSVAIVTLVGEEQFGLANRNGQQSGNSTVIRSLPTGQDKAKRTSLTVRAGVDFCRKTAA